MSSVQHVAASQEIASEHREKAPEAAFPRAGGILLHPTSLPGGDGIGDLGEQAYRFVDFLAGSCQHYWQVMPLGPTGYGDSPYQSISAFAGNPLVIDLHQLVQERCLAPWDFAGAPAFSDTRVDYGLVIDYKKRLLRLAYQNFKKTSSRALQVEFDEFIETSRHWLDDYALYAAAKDHHDGASWIKWEKDLASFDLQAIGRWRQALSQEVSYHQFSQFIFHRQWSALKDYANQKGVRIIGDIPIFVALDSADTWAHQELFYFDEQGNPSLVAGVPPDYFSATGQLWGNPLYRWEVMARDGYAWWIARFRTALRNFDLLRLDHFRGFEAFWAVPASEENAIHGEWVKGPGRDLFQAIERSLGPVPMIAEDLGLITREVEALRDELGYPGMKVLQFAFSGNADHPYLPHNYTAECVVYTGTHDNDTTLGWIQNAGRSERQSLINYLGGREHELNWELIRLAYMSVAHTVIIPLQDILSLGSVGRMNTPGSAGENWQWRMTSNALEDEIRERLKSLAEIYGRALQKPGSSVKSW